MSDVHQPYANSTKYIWLHNRWNPISCMKPQSTHTVISIIAPVPLLTALYTSLNSDYSTNAVLSFAQYSTALQSNLSVCQINCIATMTVVVKLLLFRGWCWLGFFGIQLRLVTVRREGNWHHDGNEIKQFYSEWRKVDDMPAVFGGICSLSCIVRRGWKVTARKGLDGIKTFSLAVDSLWLTKRKDSIWLCSFHLLLEFCIVRNARTSLVTRYLLMHKGPSIDKRSPLPYPFPFHLGTIKWMTNGSPSCLNSCCKADIPTYSIYCADGTTTPGTSRILCALSPYWTTPTCMWGLRVDTHTLRNPLNSCRTVSCWIYTHTPLPLNVF